MEIIFYITVSILFYTFLGYPFVLAILSFIFKKKIQNKDITPKVSLIISAYNEENIIEEKINNTLALDYPKEKLEIIVASESTDNTNKIVKKFKRKGIQLFAFKGREGKRATLYRTVPQAKGEIIVFSDANAMYEKDAIRKLVRNFNDKRIGCVSGRLKYINANNTAIGKGETSYWELELILKLLASRLFVLGGGVNGSIMAIRKDLYDPIDKNRGDDFEIALRVEINGHGVILEPEALSYEDTSEKTKEEFQRKVRLATWNLKSTLILMKEAFFKRKLLTYFLLFSHRFLRYTTPIWLITLFITSLLLMNTYIFFLLILQIIFYMLAISGYILEKYEQKIQFIFLIPLYFTMLNLAAFIAIKKNIFNESHNFWEKVR